jgi:hypothetical protein
MAAWLKVTRPNVEVGGNFVFYQSAVIDLEQATGFGLQNAGSVAVFFTGKTFVVQQQFDAAAFQNVMRYVQQRTGQALA